MNLLTSSLSTSFSVPSSPSWASGGMETDATISDETDRNVEMIKHGKLVKFEGQTDLTCHVIVRGE